MLRLTTQTDQSVNKNCKTKKPISLCAVLWGFCFIFSFFETRKAFIKCRSFTTAEIDSLHRSYLHAQSPNSALSCLFVFGQITGFVILMTWPRILNYLARSPIQSMNSAIFVRFGPIYLYNHVTGKPCKNTEEKAAQLVPRSRSLVLSGVHFGWRNSIVLG